MIILDTNVISATLPPAPVRRVVEWLDGKPTSGMFVTAVTVYEVRLGLDLMPDGKRRRDLEAAWMRVLQLHFVERVLPYDDRAAEAAARITVERQRTGRPVDLADAQIAGIATVRRATIATRNTKDFEGMGVELVNPWTA